MFFWRDRTREVDFVVDVGGRVELIEAKWTELPQATDTVNLAFVRTAVGRSKVARAQVACRAPNAYPLGDGFLAAPVVDLLKPATWEPAVLRQNRGASGSVSHEVLESG